MGEIFDKLRIQGRMQFFEKMSQSALNHVLTLPDYRTQKMLQIPLKTNYLQNDFNILVAKQWKLIISVPMSYMRLFENLTGTSNGAFKGALKCKFERQFPLVNLRGESGAQKAPYVALLIRSIKRGPGESPGAHEVPIWPF